MNRLKKGIRSFAKTVANKFIVPLTKKIAVKRIKKKKGRDTVVFISCHGMGDLIYSMLFLALQKQSDPSKKTVIVSPEKYKNIVLSYDSYDKAVFVPNSGLRNFIVHALSANITHEDKLFKDGIVAESWGIIALTDDFVKNQTDCITAARKIYGVDPNVPIVYHGLRPARVTSIPNFADVHGHVAVLNPYSASLKLSSTGTAFFEQACDLLKNKGYIVYTNVVGGQEPVNGSLELRCSLEEMMGIANMIPLVVSLRSGFLDLLAPTGVNMFVIYNVLWYYIWYKMDNWNGGGKLKEVLYEESDGSPEHLMESFRQYLDDLNL